MAKFRRPTHLWGTTSTASSDRSAPALAPPITWENFRPGDLNTGKRVWQHNFKTILWSPLLVTGGDILFAGGTPDRLFRDKKTVELFHAYDWPGNIRDLQNVVERGGDSV